MFRIFYKAKPLEMNKNYNICSYYLQCDFFLSYFQKNFKNFYSNHNYLIFYLSFWLWKHYEFYTLSRALQNIFLLNNYFILHFKFNFIFFLCNLSDFHQKTFKSITMCFILMLNNSLDCIIFQSSFFKL